jgi:hypothetical protein
MGNAGTEQDGFASLLLDAQTLLGDVPPLLAGAGLEFDAAASVVTDAATPWEQDFSDTLATTIQQGQPDFDTFAQDLQGNSPPPPPPPPTPTPAAFKCDASSPATDLGFVEQGKVGSFTRDYWQNRTGADQTITDVELEQSTPAVFWKVVTLPTTVRNGGVARFTVNVNGVHSGVDTPLGDYFATLDIFVGGMAGAIKICLHAEVVEAQPGGPLPTPVGPGPTFGGLPLLPGASPLFRGKIGDV